MRNEKNLKESQRLTQWGTDLNSKKNKKACKRLAQEDLPGPVLGVLADLLLETAHLDVWWSSLLEWHGSS